MHVFIGGAYNGKTDYVRRWIGDKAACFCTMDTTATAKPSESLVISGLHEWLMHTDKTEAEARDAVQQIISSDTVFILTDMGRGIVPLDAKQRDLRDRCGRLYQHLFAEATNVTRIWYGIPHTIKGVK
ncbi:MULTISPECIES: bifunctional adenosylcobinamide kinase/adenosylcobinamide-phosphate guanylyltransferase [Sporosarcina]|uniref:bifunctional adenosylcobinamide kinase/adenosylcobinamide-phosphate guanylyltransferase n=1 Tax=Sporosarcina TaxID=1569 RepID=UPI000A17F155|nr:MULTISPECIES: bifunctional adenosylcobinamide kinase/adenosylcobinamide-phosphate guanylyltransferase [Sporosarcina]ARK22182.1 hypothetical protein SporoP32a_12000 [Sporosarcina ureae]